MFLLIWLTLAPYVYAVEPASITVSNLQQLRNIVSSDRDLVCGVDLKATVCAASRPEVGAVILQDETGTEVIELGGCAQALQPGDKIKIEGAHCLLRGRETGIEISAAPLVNNEGANVAKESAGMITLPSGMHTLRLDYFSSIVNSELELSCKGPQMPQQKVPVSTLWHTNNSDGTNLIPGLRVESYEGYWETIPDFNWLNPSHTDNVTNIGLQFETIEDGVGLRFHGFFQAKATGEYTFYLRSASGAQLYIDDVCPMVRVLDHSVTPSPRESFANQKIANNTKTRWVSLDGRVGYITKTGRGLEFELQTDFGALSVTVADAMDLTPASFLNRRIRSKGAFQSAMTLHGGRVLGRLLVASTRDIKLLENFGETNMQANLLTTAKQVQRLNRQEAEKKLSVRIIGTVTDVAPVYYHVLSLQDDTHGIFVNYGDLTNSIIPVSGEILEVTGYTAPGDFAPIIMAEGIKRLGAGEMPVPLHPTWSQLVNGSVDVQWVELEGVINDVSSSNSVSLFMQEGNMEIRFDKHDTRVPARLESYLNCLVRIRGVFFAIWNGTTHEVQPGQIEIRNATINVDFNAPTNLFDAPLKTAHDLLRFDIQASTFQRVKVRGQITHATAGQVIMTDQGTGIRVSFKQKYYVSLRPGDVIEAVGYPDISGPSPVLRESVVRKIDFVTLPVARSLADSDLLGITNDSTLVRISGKLLGWHDDANGLVLQMQAGQQLFVARLEEPDNAKSVLISGSQLALTGIYVAHLHGQPLGRTAADGFELLLNSPTDIVVLSKPSWWTLSRMLGLVGILMLILILASLWITQLHRQVEQRTRLLKHEIKERESAERLRALEAERSRIARDLHDDLGSSLTEIGVLASAGIRHSLEEDKSPGLFRSISGKARGLIASLDVIVWAVDPEQNTLQSLADYLGGYAEEYLTNAEISCRYKIPVNLPVVTLEGRVRHDLFLAVKETLHNVVQHSRATEVEFQLAVMDLVLEIIISDNGCGIVSQDGGGHGLKNLPARLTQMGGRCEVTSRAGYGTQVIISFALSQTRNINPTV